MFRKTEPETAMGRLLGDLIKTHGMYHVLSGCLDYLESLEITPTSEDYIVKLIEDLKTTRGNYEARYNK